MVCKKDKKYKLFLNKNVNRHFKSGGSVTYCLSVPPEYFSNFERIIYDPPEARYFYNICTISLQNFSDFERYFTTHLNISQILSKFFTTHLRQDNQARNTIIFNQIISKQKSKWFSNQNTYKNSRSAWIFPQFWKNYLRPTWGKIFHPANFIFRRVSIAAICFPVNFQILSTRKE